MDPSVYGPHYWGTLHIAALYGESLEDFKTLAKSYTTLLPCKKCRRHYTQVLAEYPVDSVTLPFEWSVTVHNIVNKRIGKPVMSVEEARAHWSATPVRIPWATISMVLLVLLIIILLSKGK
jgi:hypothetical protein